MPRKMTVIKFNAQNKNSFISLPFKFDTVLVQIRIKKKKTNLFFSAKNRPHFRFFSPKSNVSIILKATNTAYTVI